MPAVERRPAYRKSIPAILLVVVADLGVACRDGHRLRSAKARPIVAPGPGNIFSVVVTIVTAAAPASVIY